MIRMIVEGSSGKSEDVFWSNFFMMLGKNFKLYFCEGNRNAKIVARVLCSDIMVGDRVLCGLDRYTWESYNVVMEMLLRKQNSAKNFDVLWLESRSFEGIFLSYKNLSSFVRLGNRAIESVLVGVSDYLRRDLSLVTKLKIYFDYFKSNGLIADIRTEEKFVSWLLAQVTHSPKDIRVDKKISQRPSH